MATYGIQPFDLVVSNLYPFAQRPDIETDRRRRSGDGAGGGQEPRLRHHRHRRVAVRAVARGARRQRQHRGRRDAPSVRDRGVREHGGVRRADRGVAATGRTPSPVHRPRARAHGRGAALRREPAPARGALPRSRARRSWWDDVQQHAGLALSLPQPLRRRRRVAPGPRPRRRRPRSRSSSTPTPAVSRSPTTSPPRTSVRSSATSARPSAASSRSTAPVDAATVERMVAGPQADLVLAPGWEPGTVDALIAKRKNTRLLDAGAARVDDPRLPPDQRRLPRAGRPPLRGDPRRLAGRHQARPHRHRVARRRAGVAHLRPREVATRSCW